jgi:diaminopropionate ammonia-lyase
MTARPRGVLTNAHAGNHHPGAAPEQVFAFHRSLPGYRSTPLVSSPDIASRLGVAEVWVKDESQRLGMPSFKILGASWATFRALCARIGANHTDVGDLDRLRALLEPLPSLTLVAATDGNHGRAVARMAQLLRLGAHILVPHDMVPARIEALEQEGAQVTVVPGTYDAAVAESARLGDESHVVISDTSWEGYERVPGWVIDGYATIAQEVSQQLGERDAAQPTVIAAQMGVGAFAASVVRGFADDGVRVVGVEPTKSACVMASIEAGEMRQIDDELDSIMAGLNCGTPSLTAWPDLISGLRYLIAIDDQDAEDAMRELAKAGVVSGESGAAGLAGLLAFGSEIGLTKHDRVLVVSTEGATDPVGYQRIVGGACLV